MARKAAGPKRDVAQEVTDLIISQLEKGTVPWQRPWAITGGQLPRSLSTGKLYTGINSFLLGVYGELAGYTSPWWGTYRQVAALGGQVKARPADVKPGDWGSTVVFYKKILVNDREAPKDAPRKVSVPLLRYFTVFNADQCDGLPEKYTAKPEPLAPEARFELAEQFVSGYVSPQTAQIGDSRVTGPRFSHGGDRAFYRPSTDSIKVPEPGQFDSPEAYYSTCFHEEVHSTGATTRLKRDGVVENHSFGDELYAAEELIAEMGAAILCGYAGIDQAATLPRSADYLANWLKVLKGDNKLILRAAAAAQKAVALIAPAEEEDEPAEVAEKELVTA